MVPLSEIDPGTLRRGTVLRDARRGMYLVGGEGLNRPVDGNDVVLTIDSVVQFVTERALLGTFQMRGNPLQIRANPRLARRDGMRVQPYAGPVAILVDETSGSASEVFAGGMQALGRARVVGDTSLGGVLPAVTDRLPNGDVLYHAIAEFVTATGVHLEGRGVVPDQPVPLTRADLLAGRDPALDAALAWIDGVRAEDGHGGSQEMANGQ